MEDKLIYESDDSILKNSKDRNWPQWILTPLICATSKSQFKLIRAAGQILSILLLPWACGVILVYFIIFLIVEAMGAVVIWWEEV